MGDFGFSLIDTALGVLSLIFLLDVVGFEPAKAALAIFIGKSWDYIGDTIVGYIAYRASSRWGIARHICSLGSCLLVSLLR